VPWKASYIGAACESKRFIGRRPRISSIERSIERKSYGVWMTAPCFT
jgi:hypothetical protein